MKTILALGALALVAAAAAACSSGSGTEAPDCDLAYVSAENCAAAHAMALPTSLPAARGNKYAGDLNAATLGFYIFFDTDLGTGVGCVTCHAPELAFTDRLSVSLGKTNGTRNAPTIFNVARLSVFFWDGRADSLWSQPLFAIENPLEMASTRLGLAQFIAGDAQLAALYQGEFGPFPDMSAWPAVGKPGDPAFDGLSPDVQDQVNRLAANVGKSLEAYMRLNTTASGPLDRYLAGDASQIPQPAQRGLNVFLANNCATCHSGSMLTDESFHDVGFPSLAGAPTDTGRAQGLPVLQANIFNLAGPYADPGPGIPASIPAGPGPVDAFRTPSLRNVPQTFPYGHDGALPDLPSVLAVHAPGLSKEDQGDLLAFLGTLNGDDPPPPWNNWPSPQ